MFKKITLVVPGLLLSVSAFGDAYKTTFTARVPSGDHTLAIEVNSEIPYNYDRYRYGATRENQVGPTVNPLHVSCANKQIDELLKIMPDPVAVTFFKRLPIDRLRINVIDNVGPKPENAIADKPVEDAELFFQMNVLPDQADPIDPILEFKPVMYKSGINDGCTVVDSTIILREMKQKITTSRWVTRFETPLTSDTMDRVAEILKIMNQNAEPKLADSAKVDADRTPAAKQVPSKSAELVSPASKAPSKKNAK